MDYVSFNIETTGLDPKTNQILEIGAVATCIGGNLDKVHTLSLLVIPDGPIVTDPYCAKLHQRLWERLIPFHGKSPTASPSLSYKQDNHGTVTCRGQTREKELAVAVREWLDKAYPGGALVPKAKITVAGKNAASFDVPFLEARCDIRARLDIRHRMLDVASHFWRPGDIELPNLDKCLQRADMCEVTAHDALGDAMLVCKLVNFAYARMEACT